MKNFKSATLTALTVSTLLLSVSAAFAQDNGTMNTQTVPSTVSGNNGVTYGTGAGVANSGSTADAVGTPSRSRPMHSRSHQYDSSRDNTYNAGNYSGVPIDSSSAVSSPMASTPGGDLRSDLDAQQNNGRGADGSYSGQNSGPNNMGN